ncbi:contact-dependent growth inhibition system immunity protein [Siccibacter turicensis]|uniref:contact-dependent growth inhibition system immunity protein n=1 Tax=Siccibacter turicensis TaxID=357233 RepID=UPI001022648A|nr:contact-dependent growth inhibition system immunity protein [Siccibacter turicensis]
MITFRTLLLNGNSNYEPQSHSSLDEWFSSIVDIPINELGVGDVARAIRQDLFLAEVLPKAETILRKDPLAGEDYDGQLISSIASLNCNEAKPALHSLQSISAFLNQLDKTGLDSQVVMDIEKIDKLSHA